jgi:catechol 2,3-dioxygenase-like lactoylglutathione lyase family enzyme
MTITGFDHYTIRCADLQASWRFYADVLGLRVVERAGISIPAAIVYLDDMMLIHLFQSGDELEAIFARLQPPPGDPEAARWSTGRLQHNALQARGLPDMRQRLAHHGSAVTERTIAGQSKHLVVLRDPDNIEIELSFALQEVQNG